MIRSYSQMSTYATLEERFRYLSLHGDVGRSTFGFDRYVNQRFYTSAQWRHVRSQVIVRDGGQDLGVEGYEIHGKLLIHHMNPMLIRDIEQGLSHILDPEFLITTTHRTHNAIHFGDERQLPRPLAARRHGDTALW